MDLLAMPSEAAETSQPAAELSDEHDISGSDGQLFVALSTAAFAGTDGLEPCVSLARFRITMCLFLWIPAAPIHFLVLLLLINYLVFS